MQIRYESPCCCFFLFIWQRSKFDMNHPFFFFLIRVFNSSFFDKIIKSLFSFHFFTMQTALPRHCPSLGIVHLQSWLRKLRHHPNNNHWPIRRNSIDTLYSKIASAMVPPLANQTQLDWQSLLKNCVSHGSATGQSDATFLFLSGCGFLLLLAAGRWRNTRPGHDGRRSAFEHWRWRGHELVKRNVVTPNWPLRWTQRCVREPGRRGPPGSGVNVRYDEGCVAPGRRRRGWRRRRRYAHVLFIASFVRKIHLKIGKIWLLLLLGTIPAYRSELPKHFNGPIAFNLS